MLLQVMKYEDLLNWKKINALENIALQSYIDGLLKQSLFMEGNKLEKMTWQIIFNIFHATRYSKARLTPNEILDEGEGNKVHLAICLKKTGSITNLGSGEGQVQQGEVII